MKVFWAVFSKEILMFFRNFGLVLFVIYSFTLDIYTAAKGIDVKPKNVSIGYVDKTKGAITTKILTHFHKPEFKQPIEFQNEKELKKTIFNKKIIVGLIFDNDFYHTKTINVLVDATNASQADVTLIYLKNILFKMSNIHLPLEIKSHILFNQNASSPYFMAISEMISVVTMLGLILIAIVFVKEKEQGTWDIMLLMPVDAKIIILAKFLSQIVILMIGIFIAMGIIVFGVFHTPMNGNFLYFLLLSFIYLFSISGIGLVIAAISKSVMQVSQYSLLVMMPMLFLSGTWTPINSMNWFLQKLSLLSPLRYYIQGVESIVFRGTQFVDLIPYFAGELFIGIILFYFGFKKIGRLF